MFTLDLKNNVFTDKIITSSCPGIESDRKKERN